ncbi:hypothetical protein [Massilia niabensis]|uniref:Uncharacterized protein n=1 Tax=Massilia niabensis TaxID=544910 RepID=A0ABW0L8S3_9BURK
MQVHEGSPSATDARDVAPRIFSTGGLALAGLFGGPLAIAYLTCCDLKTLGLSDRLRACAAWFGPLIALWFYLIFSVPPDVISQLLPHLLQVILWWMVARHLLARTHARYRNEGGLFRSRWTAVGMGIATYFALKLVFAAGVFAQLMWLN